MKDLSSKVAIVTGSSKGIGAAIARLLGGYGARVIVNYLSAESAAEAVVRDVIAAGSTAIAVRADVSRKADVAELFARAQQSFGQIDILINNSGIFKNVRLNNITEEHFWQHFNLNVLGVILGCQQANRCFGLNGGSIVNIGSIVSDTTPPYSTVYTATKSAVDSITRTLSKELASRRIRINSVNPGLVDTEGLQSTGAIYRLRRIAAQSSLGRIMCPDEIAPAVVYFASSASAPITGRILDLQTPFAPPITQVGRQKLLSVMR